MNECMESHACNMRLINFHFLPSRFPSSFLPLQQPYFWYYFSQLKSEGMDWTILVPRLKMEADEEGGRRAERLQGY